MPSATAKDVEHQRYRIKAAYRLGNLPEDDYRNLLKCSKVMGRFRSEWGHHRHESVLKRLFILATGATKYDPGEMHDTTLSAALEDRDATGELVEWIYNHYPNEESNRDMRGALRTFGKVLTNDDPTDKEATPPPSIEWVPATLPRNYRPVPDPSDMISWTETRDMCEHSGTNRRDAALLAVAWDAGPRSGELEKLKVGDVSDHDVGKIIRVDGKTGQRDVTITNAVPYLRQWLNSHPAPDDDDAPLWSKLKSAEPISYRMFRNIFKDAAERVGLDKPDDPTNFRKSSASALASKGVSQAHLEKRYGWKRGSDAAARYIRVFGQDADRELAEARGMDVNLTEPEPDGPKDCKRCGVLIDRDAEQCDNCGFIQDREKAFDETTPHGDIDRMVEEFVREEMPSNTELREMVRDTLGEVLLGSDLPTLSEEDLEALKAREEDRAPITDFPDLGTADEQ